MPAGWISAGAAAVGAIGSLAASSNSNSAAAGQAANNNAPWQQAQPYVTQGYTDDQNYLNSATAMGTNGAYSGERVAGLNGYQTAGANQAGQYASGQGLNTQNGLYNGGMSAMQQGANYGNNATSLMQQATNPNAEQGFINAGNQLANSSTTQGMIDSANLATSRDLNETQLPSLLTSAEGQGGNDNTRTGIAQGLLESQAQQNMLANASNIQGQMFNEGMSSAQNQYNTGIQNGINANGQVGQSFNNGGTALMNGQQAAGNNMNLSQQAGGVFQNQQQQQDNGAMQDFSDQQNNNLNLLQKYQGIINGSYGGADPSGVGTSNVASGLQGAMTGAAAGYGLYNTLGGSFNGTSGTNQYGFTTGMPSSYGMSTGSSGDYNYTNPSYGASLGY